MTVIIFLVGLTICLYSFRYFFNSGIKDNRGGLYKIIFFSLIKYEIKDMRIYNIFRWILVFPLCVYYAISQSQYNVLDWLFENPSIAPGQSGVVSWLRNWQIVIVPFILSSIPLWLTPKIDKDDRVNLWNDINRKDNFTFLEFFKLIISARIEDLENNETVKKNTNSRYSYSENLDSNNEFNQNSKTFNWAYRNTKKILITFFISIIVFVFFFKYENNSNTKKTISTNTNNQSKRYNPYSKDYQSKSKYEIEWERAYERLNNSSYNKYREGSPGDPDSEVNTFCTKYNSLRKGADLIDCDTKEVLMKFDKNKPFLLTLKSTNQQVTGIVYYNSTEQNSETVYVNGLAHGISKYWSWGKLSGIFLNINDNCVESKHYNEDGEFLGYHYR